MHAHTKNKSFFDYANLYKRKAKKVYKVYYFIKKHSHILQ